jgi:hypothetical protein
VRVQIVPDEYDRVGELLMGGVQELDVVRLGEPLALVLGVAALRPAPLVTAGQGCAVLVT